MKLFYRIITTMLICSLLVGCWGVREPSQLSIVTALGIDKEKEYYLVTVQVLNPSEIGTTNKTGTTQGVPVTTYRMTGRTIEEALKRLSLKLPRNVFLGHLRLLIFGEEVAREGIGNTLDFLLRDSEIRSDFYMTVVQDRKATEALNILTPLEKIPANKLYFSFEVSEKVWAATATIKLFEFVETLEKEGAEPVLGSVVVTGSDKAGMNIKNLEDVDVNTVIKAGTMAAFKGDKLVGWLNDPQSALVDLMIGKAKGYFIQVPWYNPSEYVSLSAAKIKRTIDVEEVMGKPKIKVNVEMVLVIEEAMGDVPIDKPETIKKIESRAEEYLTARLSKATSEIQSQLNTDVLGFGDVIKNKDYKLWKSIGNEWDNYFPNLPVEYKVNLIINDTGTTTKTLKPSH